MKFAIDMAYKSINHMGEELCGDKVEMVDKDDSRILILADGMGSGIRANILATLTSKIIATLMYNDQPIDEAVTTVMSTLPVSSVNNAAYSTFSIIQVFNSGDVYVAEYDNPECVMIREGDIYPLPFNYREVDGKRIRECRFKAQIGDALVIFSDGCLYCGPDQIINYDWDWNAFAECCKDSVSKIKNASQLAYRLHGKCSELYEGKQTDDATVAVALIGLEKAVNIITGPPENKEDDERMVYDFYSMSGTKIVAGGSTSEMVARVLEKRIVTNTDHLDPKIPPTSRIDGIDLVTEGVITLNKTIDLLEHYQSSDVTEDFFEELCMDNGAAHIACYLIEECTSVNLFIGRSVNKIYMTKNLPFEVSVRQALIQRLEKVLRAMHCNVTLRYY